MNTLTKQIVSMGSVRRGICSLLSAILNTGKFENAPFLIIYAEAKCISSAMINQLWAEHKMSQVGGASGNFNS